MEGAKMRKAAGILIIIGGFIVGAVLVNLRNSGIHGFLVFTPQILTLIGGIMALKRVVFFMALVGAISLLFMTIMASVFGDPSFLLFSPMGILSVVFLIKRKYEFD